HFAYRLTIHAASPYCQTTIPPMRLQILSDLHLESNPDFTFAPEPDVDLLVLAGDIGSYQAGSALDGADFGLERYAPLGREASWPNKVLYVPGNHEFDGLDFDETMLRLRQTCKRLGIIWLEKETVVLDGIRFVALRSGPTSRPWPRGKKPKRFG